MAGRPQETRRGSCKAGRERRCPTSPGHTEEHPAGPPAGMSSCRLAGRGEARSLRSLTRPEGSKRQAWSVNSHWPRVPSPHGQGGRGCLASPTRELHAPGPPSPGRMVPSSPGVKPGPATPVSNRRAGRSGSGRHPPLSAWHLPHWSQKMGVAEPQVTSLPTRGGTGGTTQLPERGGAHPSPCLRNTRAGGCGTSWAPEDGSGVHCRRWAAGHAVARPPVLPPRMAGRPSQGVNSDTLFPRRASPGLGGRGRAPHASQGRKPALPSSPQGPGWAPMTDPAQGPPPAGRAQDAGPAHTAAALHTPATGTGRSQHERGEALNPVPGVWARLTGDGAGWGGCCCLGGDAAARA